MPPTGRRSSARQVLATAGRVCRHHTLGLVVIGLVVFAPLAMFEAVATAVVHDNADGGPGARTIAIGTYLGISLLMFGSALCAGLLDTVVGREFGEDDPGLLRAARTLPYGRLIGVDLAQAVLIGTLSLLGFVPGLIAFTLTCLAGSLVMIERRGVRSALRRSVDLTRRRGALTFLVVALPVAIEHQVVHGLSAWIGMPFLWSWLLHAIAAVVLLVPVVVVEITLAHMLIRDEAG